MRRTRLALPTVLVATTLATAVGCPDDEPTGAASEDTDDDRECRIAEEDECEAHPACMWGHEVEFCVVDCSQLDDQPTCEQATFCEWIDAACIHHAT